MRLRKSNTFGGAFFTARENEVKVINLRTKFRLIINYIIKLYIFNAKTAKLNRKLII